MLKQILKISSIFIIVSSLIIAQQKPGEQNDAAQKDSLVTTVTVEESVDSSSIQDPVELQIWNKVCPVMGNKVDVDGPTVEYNGKLYGFCCPGCDAKFEKNPEKYSKNLNEDGTRFIGRK
jgi:YHS domain-containing protein